MKVAALGGVALFAMMFGNSVAYAAGPGGGPIGPVCVSDDDDDGDCPASGDGGTPATPGSGTSTPGSGSGSTGTAGTTTTGTATITFDALTRGATLGTYIEGAYSVQLVTGSIVGGFGQSTLAGATVGLDTLGPLAAAYVPGSPTPQFSVQRTDGGAFSVDSFFSVRLSGVGVNSVTIQGFNGGVAGGSATVVSSFDGFGYPQPSTLTGTYDRALFTLSTTSSGLSFDSLTVTAAPLAAAAPEPSSWALMILGFGLTGAAMRRRKTKIMFHHA